MSANALAACLGLPVDTLERLLNACCAFGLLKKYDRTFTLTEASVEYLVKGSPNYIGGMFEHLRRDIYPL